MKVTLEIELERVEGHPFYWHVHVTQVLMLDGRVHDSKQQQLLCDVLMDEARARARLSDFLYRWAIGDA